MNKLLERLRTDRTEEGAALLSVVLLSLFVFVVISTLAMGTLFNTTGTANNAASVKAIANAESGIDDALHSILTKSCHPSQGSDQFGFTYEIYRSAGEEQPTDENSFGVYPGCPEDGDTWVIVKSQGDGSNSRITTITNTYRWTGSVSFLESVNGALINGGGGTNLSRLVINGSDADFISLSGNFDCNNISRIEGNLYVINGTVRISNACYIGGSIYSTGTVQIQNPAVAVEGDIYSLGNIAVSNPATVNGSLYARGAITLSSGSRIGGDVISESPTALTIDNSTIGGRVSTNGRLQIQNGTVITGNVYSSSTSDVNFYNSRIDGDVRINGNFSQLGLTQIGGSVYAGRNASNNIHPNTTIGGDLILGGTISTWGTGPIVGGGTRTKQAVDSLMPVLFDTPEQLEAGYFKWKDYGFNAPVWTNAGYTVEAFSQCNFQGNATLINRVNNFTDKTVIDLRGCSSPQLYGVVFDVQTDIAIFTNSFAGNTLRVNSADGQQHRFDVIVEDLVDNDAITCSSGQGEVNLYNFVASPAINSFIYSPCRVAIGGTSTINGQVYAGRVAYSAGGGMQINYEKLTVPGFPSDVASTSQETYVHNGQNALPVLMGHTEVNRAAL